MTQEEAEAVLAGVADLMPVPTRDGRVLGYLVTVPGGWVVDISLDGIFEARCETPAEARAWLHEHVSPLAPVS